MLKFVISASPQHPPQHVSQRNMQAVSILVIVIALQFAAINSSWHSTESHAQRTDLGPNSWDHTSTEVYDYLHQRTTVNHDTDNGTNWDQEPDYSANSGTVENVDMLGEFDNTVKSKRIVLVALYCSLTLSITTLLLSIIRSLGTPSKLSTIITPSLASLLITLLVLTSFPFVFDPDPDYTDSNDDSSTIVCEEESGISVPNFWTNVEGKNCQFYDDESNSNGAEFDIQVKSGISTGYYISIIVLLLQLYTLKLVRWNR